MPQMAQTSSGKVELLQVQFLDHGVGVKHTTSEAPEFSYKMTDRLNGDMFVFITLKTASSPAKERAAQAAPGLFEQ
jgi:hypothetical protein